MHTLLRFRPAPIALLVLAAVALSLPAARAEAAIDAASEEQLECLTNDARGAEGRRALRVAPDLTEIARRHSARMAAASDLHHNPQLGREVQDWLVVAENVGRGPSISSIHNALLASSGHRANILDTRVTEMGIGVERRDGQYWVTQIFRAPSGADTGSLPRCTQSLVLTSGGGVPVTGDWDGDGTVTPGVFRDGTWELSNQLSTRPDLRVTFGRRGDLPVVGDWNGDGKDGIGIVRADRWILSDSADAPRETRSFSYGRVTSGDVPVVGDWNGSGIDGVGIIRNGEWHLRNALSSGPGQLTFVYGRLTRGDLAIVGDWTGNGRDGIGIVRGGEWHLRNRLSAGPAEREFVYGRVRDGDTPVIGDWTATGRAGIGIVRNGDWYLRHDLSAGYAHQVLTR
ncbi:MAG: CAP domain-containing protein [Nitriliruptoraceae bacterium]